VVFPPIRPAVETHHLTTSSQFQEAVIDRCLQLGESCTNWRPNNQLLAENHDENAKLSLLEVWIHIHCTMAHLGDQKNMIQQNSSCSIQPHGKTLWTETEWNEPVCSKINYCNSNHIEMEEFLFQSLYYPLYIKRLSFSSQPASLSLSAVGGVSMRGEVFQHKFTLNFPSNHGEKSLCQPWPCR